MVWLTKESKASVDIAFGILVSSINIFQAVYLSRYKRKRSNYETVLLSLSIADLLYGVSNICIGVIFFASAIHEEIFEITVTTYFFFVLTSILHLSWITIDRLWAIYSPIKHNYILTKTKINIVLTLTWTSTIFVSLFLILHDELIVEKNKDSAVPSNISVGIVSENLTEHISRYQSTMETTLSSFIAVANGIFVVAYGILVYVLMCKNRKSIASKQQQLSRGFSKEYTVVLTCLMISVSFLCFTLPFAITVFVDGKSSDISGFLLQLNSAANSIVYFLRNKMSACIKTNNNNKQLVDSKSTPTSTLKLSKEDHLMKSLDSCYSSNLDVSENVRK